MLCASFHPKTFAMLYSTPRCSWCGRFTASLVLLFSTLNPHHITLILRFATAGSHRFCCCTHTIIFFCNVVLLRHQAAGKRLPRTNGAGLRHEAMTRTTRTRERQQRRHKREQSPLDRCVRGPLEGIHTTRTTRGLPPLALVAAFVGVLYTRKIGCFVSGVASRIRSTTAQRQLLVSGSNP